MRKSLAFILTLVALAFVATGANATVKLTQQQVKDQCGGKTDGLGYSYCQKSCGGGNTCEFGCGPKGCGGTCLTCKSASRASSNSIVRASLTGALNKNDGSGKINDKSASKLLVPQGGLITNNATTSTNKLGTAGAAHRITTTPTMLNR